MTYNNWKRWHQAQNGSAGNRAVDGLPTSSREAPPPRSSPRDPAVYGVLIERIGTYGGADLPFEEGVNLNGALLARSQDGTF